ncbi:MAG: hypothetical protein EPN22_06600 [Nitrospirae bacterium]|nr:MAG: hypothetical protein EPN22_06600 [Nitrospirota bacterium]
MTKHKKNINFITVAVIILTFLLSCDPRYGFIESTFRLADESRLPIWFKIPLDYARKDLTMAIIFYSSPAGGNVKMALYGPAPENKKLMEEIGTNRYHPLTEKQNKGTYPRYIIITVNDIEEVFEHRGRNDIFYITDDPKLTSVLKQTKK